MNFMECVQSGGGEGANHRAQFSALASALRIVTLSGFRNRRTIGREESGNASMNAPTDFSRVWYA